MSVISTQFFANDGTAPTFAAAAVGDQARVSDKHFLIVKNSGAAATVTVAVPGTLFNGVAVPDTTVTVASTTGEVWVALDVPYGDPALAAITYSTTTGLTRAVVKR
jgi:hypothetical protein